jgi:periplasmic protein CpxP/Spy
MEKTIRIYQWLVGLLVLLNLGLIGSFWFFKGQQPFPPARNIGHFLIKEVGFSDEQADQYKSMIEEHQRTNREIFGQIRKAKSELFHFSDPDPQKKQAILEQIAQLHAQQDQATFDHFNKVRALLRPDQQTIFDRIITDLLENQNGPVGPPMGFPPFRRP